MNKNNKLKLKRGEYVVVVDLKEGLTIAIPTKKGIANAKVVDVFPEGSFTAHWIENYNLRGDFSTELMFFGSSLVLNEEDLLERNKIRVGEGLLKI